MEAGLVKLLQGCTSLPSPPGVASRIIELNSSPHSTLLDIADAVGVDPALSVKLLRMANSPLYSQQRKIENLRQAIGLFGIEGTLNVALSFSLKNSTQENEQSGLDYKTYWRRSLAAALLSQEVGEHIMVGAKDSLFLVGLLQDIGVLALDKIYPEMYQQSDEKESSGHAFLIGQERQIISTDHSEVGVWLLKKWNLPENIVAPIANSHLFLKGNPPEDFDKASICIAASCLMADIFVAEDTQTAIFHAIEEVQKITDMQPSEYHEIIEAVSKNFSVMANMFDITIENPAAISSITDQAQEILAIQNLNMMRKTRLLEQETDQLKNQAVELEQASRQDALTSLFNRRHFDATIEKEFENSVRYKWPLGVIFVDLDHFKAVNDTYGHKAGDDVLKQAAKFLTDCMRSTDFISRYGGEEFVILLPGTDSEGTESACNRLVDWFNERPIQLDSTEVLHQTISAGAVVYYGGKEYDNWSQLLQHADTAVYHAKSNGRNQYCMYRNDLDTTTHSIAV